MYKLTRNIHLLLGLSAALVILVYAVSAVQMAHQYTIKPQISNQDLALPAGLQARTLAQVLMDQHGYRGDLGEVKSAGGRLSFTISRPGTSYAVSYEPSTGSTHVQRRELPFMGLLNRMHHLNGFGHTSMALNAWAWSLAWVSVTLLALGVTGVYMWFRLYKERLIGSILLGFNVAVSIALLVLLRS